MELRRELRSASLLAILAALAVSTTYTSAAHALIMQHLRIQRAESTVIPFGPPTYPHSLPLRVPNPKAYATSKARAERGYLAWAARHPQTSGSGSQTLAPRTAAPHTVAPIAPAPRVVLFEGLNQAGMIGGGGNTSTTPPDTTGAIGPNAYVEMVNSEIAVYNRETLALEKSMSEDQFVGKSSTCDGQIRWDQQAERWEYASLDCGLTGTEGFTFGWSKTADPTNLEGGWCKYHASTKTTLFDYPKLGGDNDFLLIGFNAFEAEVKPAEKYAGSGVVVIPKPAKGATECASKLPISAWELPVFTPVPANVYGSSATGYIVASEYAQGGSSAKNLDLFTVTKAATGKPEFHAQPEVSVPTYYMPAPVPQPSSTDTIDSSDTRLTQAVADENPNTHQMQVWTQHTVATTSLGSPSVVAWYAVKAGSSTPVQSGNIEAPAPGNFAFDGAISPTARGNGAVIDYATGGAAIEIELHAQSRAPITPSGQMENDVKLAESEDIDKDFSCPSITGEGAPCRWGDYAGASPDPLHPAVVWGTSQVNGSQETEHHNSQWKTRNFALALRSQLPTAAFSVATPSPAGGVPVKFDASASSDPAGEEIVAYDWSFGDETTGSGEKPQHTYARPGKYTVTLSTMDNGGLTDTVEHEVTIADSPPTASFSASPSSPATGEAVTFDGTPSSDIDGAIVSYAWSFSDGSPTQEGPTATVSHTFATPGTHHVTLTVTDDKGLTNTSGLDIVVDAPPVASFVVSSTSPTAMTPLGFNGSASNDTDGTVTRYRWSFGDGSTAEGVTPSHTYAAAGRYTVTLAVTDNAGKSSSVSQTVTVADAAPSASLTVSSSPTAGLPVTFDGSGSKDADGSIASYAWNFGDGTSADGSQATHVYTKAGVYTIKLTVTDNAGIAASGEASVAVAAPSSVFQVLGVKPNKKDGSALLAVSVPGPGTLSASAASSAHVSLLSAFFSAFADWQMPTAHTAKSKRHKHLTSVAFIKPVSMTASGASTLTLKLLPTSAGQKQLSRKHKLSVNVTLTFAPLDGTPGARTQPVVLQKAPPKARRHK